MDPVISPADVSYAPEALTPAAAPAPVSDESSNADADLWAGIDAEIDADDLSNEDDAVPPITAPPAAEPAPAAPTPAPAPVEAAPVAPAPVEPTPAPEPVTPPVAQVTEPAPTAPTPESLAQMREQFTAQLEQSYAMTPEEARDFELDPGKNFPRIAANLHMRVAESITQTLASMLPSLITQQVQQLNTAQQGVETFFKEWPELNNPQYHQKIAEVATLYRQLNPNATPQERVKAVGVQAWAALGLPLEKLLSRGQVSVQQQVAAPVAPLVSGGFAPANPGGTPHGAAPVGGANGNPFTQLAAEFLFDDEGD